MFLTVVMQCEDIGIKKNFVGQKTLANGYLKISGSPYKILKKNYLISKFLVSNDQMYKK